MFKCRAAGQRITPSEPAAPSMAPAPAPTTTSDSISADLGYLHHVGDEEREGYANGEQPPRIQYPRPARIWRDGLYVPAIDCGGKPDNLAGFNARENRSRDESDPLHRASRTPSSS